MSGKNLFLVAAMQAFRFPSVQGELSTEQLFQLPLTTTRNNRASLNNVAQEIYNNIQQQGQVDFVGTGSASTTDQQKLELVKEVIAIKQAENDIRRQSEEKAKLRNLLAEKIEQKKTQALDELSVEELQQKLAEIS